MRGRFSGLSEASRQSLSEAQDEHDVSRAEFTREGTLAYDSRIDFFGFRFEVRSRGERADEVAAEIALREVELFMNTLGLGDRGLGVTVSHMSEVWPTRRAPV